MAVPQLWLLAGGNGAGKSTFYRLYLKPRGIPFVNADIIAQHLFPEDPEQLSYAASQQAERIRLRYLEEQRSFCFETVFSHPSKIDFLAQAKTLGYAITLVFIHLEFAQLNQARVAQRVSEGGHSVPPEKISSRIPRTLEYIKAAIPLADRVEVLDNSRQDQPFQRVLSIVAGKQHKHRDPLPEWAKDLGSDPHLTPIFTLSPNYSVPNPSPAASAASESPPTRRRYPGPPRPVAPHACRDRRRHRAGPGSIPA